MTLWSGFATCIAASMYPCRPLELVAQGKWNEIQICEAVAAAENCGCHVGVHSCSILECVHLPQNFCVVSRAFYEVVCSNRNSLAFSARGYSTTNHATNNRGSTEVIFPDTVFCRRHRLHRGQSSNLTPVPLASM